MATKIREEMMRDNWPEVTEAELQEWLDTKSPDYLLNSEWMVGLAVKDRRTGETIAIQEEQGMTKGGRCFVHPDYLRQVRGE